jgi:phosphoribosylglycinamide formyltransferase-1
LSDLRVGFFVSGNGSTFDYLAIKMREGFIHAVPAVVISSNAKAFALERARKLDIAAFVVREQDYPDSASYANTLLEALQLHRVNFICLAGFLKLVPEKILDTFPDRIINIHPALLPAFGGKGMYGSRVHEAVIQSGARTSGATVHLVNNEYDRGAIIAQESVDVLPSDTAESLAERVHAMEVELYANTLKAIAEDRIQIKNGTVILSERRA